MPLQRLAPGVWTDPALPPATAPGLRAVIVGISRYTHLPGAEGPATETYGLRQLYTSATAAWNLFTWLRDAHRGPVPVVSVRLLLAPSDAELAHTPAMSDDLVGPTLDGCSLAVATWFEEMRALPAAAAKESQSLFFFSGHGLEVRQDQQILLPSDYLAPPARNVSRAIGTNRLRQALATLGVPRQLFFLDACRNDNADLRKLDIVPYDVLTVPGAAATNPELVSPVFYATASGTQAWQRKDPAAGTTIFADALLDGLMGTPPLQLVAKEPEGFAVTVFPLQRFVKARMAELHKALSSTVSQPLVLTGNVDDIEVTWVAQEATDEVPQPLDPVPRFGEPSFVPQGAMDPREAPWQDVHAATGHEWLTSSFRNMRVLALRDGAWADGDRFDIVRTWQSDDVLRVDLRPRGRARAWWLALGAGDDGVACVLPADERAAAVYRIDVELGWRPDAQGEGGPRDRVIRLRASLSPASDDPLDEAARQWEAYEDDSLVAALHKLPKDPDDLVRLMHGKVTSPMAAMVGAILLLRGRPRRVWDRDADVPSGWLPNLAQWFPWLPDGAALWAWHAMGSPGGASASREAMKLVAERGIPWSADGLSMAAEVLDWLRPPRVPDAPAGTAARFDDPLLDGLDARLRATMPSFRPGGLFASWAGPIDHLTPRLLGD